MLDRKENLLEDSDLPFSIFDAKGSGDTNFVHYHDCLEINVVLGGSGVNYIENQKYEMKKGDIYIINPFEHHFAAVQRHLKMKVIIFKADYIWQNCPENYDFIQPFYVKNSVGGNRIALSDVEFFDAVEIVGLLEREYKGLKHGRQLFIKAGLMALLAVIYRNVCSEETKNLTIYQNSAYEKIRPAAEYIQKHMEEPLTLDMLAKLSCMSRTYFCAYFKKVMQMTVSEYIEIVRVNKARLLLETTGYSSLEIAYLCGYGSLSGFNAAFKRLSGISPGLYRKSLRENSKNKTLLT